MINKFLRKNKNDDFKIGEIVEYNESLWVIIGFAEIEDNMEYLLLNIETEDCRDDFNDLNFTYCGNSYKSTGVWAVSAENIKRYGE